MFVHLQNDGMAPGNGDFFDDFAHFPVAQKCDFHGANVVSSGLRHEIASQQAVPLRHISLSLGAAFRGEAISIALKPQDFSLNLVYQKKIATFVVPN